MNIIIKTRVAGNYRDVFAKFDRELFEALTPPGMKVDLVRFDGSATGDIVHIRLSILGLIKQEWISKITEDRIEDDKAWFIDEGEKLPGFLSYWKHRHIVRKSESGSIIVDNITYKTPFILLDWLIYPALYLQFAYRKPVYRKFFRS